MCALAAAGIIVLALRSREAVQDVPEAGTEEIPEAWYEMQENHDAASGKAAEIARKAAERNLAKRNAWLEKMASRVEASQDAVKISSCRIENGSIVLSAEGEYLVSSDDEQYHLIAQDVWQEGTAGTEVAQISLEELEESEETAFQVTVPLGKNSASSNLFRRFLLAVEQDGELHAISRPRYIENPSACATKYMTRNDHGKKGILPAAATLRSNSLASLNCKQALYNMRLGDLCSGGGVSYTYNGRTYSFNAGILQQYDFAVTRLNEMGMQVTMVILNNSNGDSSMLHPSSRGGSAHYYAFNSAEENGGQKLEAIAAFLAERYSGSGHGNVDNWIIGNEVNARAEWYYMSSVGLDKFVEEYTEAFRIFYNGIKSVNGNARIYACIDQQWASSSNISRYYSGKSFLQAFNAKIAAEGNIDWGLAAHPYNVPLYDPKAWVASSRAPRSSEAGYLTMYNVAVLTDLLSTADYLSPDGSVRSVLLSELGYTSSQGDALQAASVVYAYLQVANNQHIDGLILSRETDDAGEIAQGLANGLRDTAGNPKLAFSYYAGIDGPDAQTWINAAQEIMGIQDISSILTPR